MKYKCGKKHVHNSYLICYNGLVLLLFLSAFFIENSQFFLSDLGNAVRRFALTVLGNSDKTFLMDAFGVIWGMTITLVLFFLEVREVCWYGVSLKNAVGLFFGNEWLLLTGIVYIMLCPAVYLAELYGYYVIALCGITCTFAAFAVIPIFILAITRKKKIRKLLTQSTVMRAKQLAERNQPAYVQMQIEDLPITSMIEHVDYENSAEVDCLLDTLLGLFEDYDLHAVLERSVYSHAVITTWMNRILDKADIDKKWGADCFGYIQAMFLSRLHLLMKAKSRQKEDYADDMTAYAVELLIPLIRDGSENAGRIFRMIWDDMTVLRLPVIGYLLLYTEFYYCECSGVLKSDFRNFVDDIELDYDLLRRQCCLWDKRLALKLWRSWTVFRDDGHNMIMTAFLDFCRDIECIALDTGEGVHTFAVRRAVIKTGGRG